jgi:hypothetical protein
MFETFPGSQEHQRCLAGLNQVLKTCWYIKPNTDDKTKLQATAIISDCYKYVMDLTTNGATIITNALSYVSGKAEKLKLESETNESKESESEEPDYGEEELEERQEKNTGELEDKEERGRENR